MFVHDYLPNDVVRVCVNVDEVRKYLQNSFFYHNVCQKVTARMKKKKKNKNGFRSKIGENMRVSVNFEIDERERGRKKERQMSEIE
jgi:hypothetical protein